MIPHFEQTGVSTGKKSWEHAEHKKGDIKELKDNCSVPENIEPLVIVLFIAACRSGLNNIPHARHL